jgi:hypothetical protein
MTVIKLDAATLAQFRAVQGRVVLADESGKPVKICVLPPVPLSEPELSEEEWKRRMDPMGGMSTGQLLEYLEGLGNP